MKRKQIYLLICLFILNIAGILALYSALYTKGGSVHTAALSKQIIWIIAGWLFIFIIYNTNYRILYDAATWLFYITLILLIGVFIAGKVQMGAQRWLNIFGINLQPSELAKLSSLILIVRILSKPKNPEGFFRDFWNQIIMPFIPIGILAFLIFIQPDLGTGLVLLMLYFMLILFSTAKKRNIFILLLTLLMLIPTGWFMLKDYQKDRLLVFINPNSDPLGTGYTIIQSKIAIGSGEFWGRGFLSGTQNQLNFLPAHHTDFIFTVFAEEWGFLGCLILLSTYYMLLKIILDTSLRAPDKFSYYLCLGIFSLLFIHIFINLAMIMGLIPVVGLPLPFLSYGGSFTLISFILIGIVISIQKHIPVK
jgi:rod shape determining protein RodA